MPPGIVLGLGAAGYGRRAIFAVVAMAVLLAVPEWLLLAGAVIAGNTSLTTLSLAPFTALDILLGVWLARQVPVVLSRRRLVLPRSTLLLVGFIGWVWFATVRAGVTITPIGRITLYAVVGIVMTLVVWPNEMRRRNLAIAIVAFDLIEMVISVPQVTSRLVGTTVNDPGTFGVLLLAGLAFLRAGVLGFSVQHERMIQAILIAGVLATRTRGVWLALLVLLFLSSLRGRLSRRRLIGTGLAFGVLALLLYGPVTARLGLNSVSGQLRQRSIEAGIAAGRRSPLAGHGWAGFTIQARDDAGQRRHLTDAERFEQAIASPYNLFVNVFASSGIPGLLLIVGALWAVIDSAARRDRAAFLFLAAFVSLSFTEMTFYAGATITVLFFIMAAFAEAPDREIDEDVGRLALR